MAQQRVNPHDFEVGFRAALRTNRIGFLKDGYAPKIRSVDHDSVQKDVYYLQLLSLAKSKGEYCKEVVSADGTKERKKYQMRVDPFKTKYDDILKCPSSTRAAASSSQPGALQTSQRTISAMFGASLRTTCSCGVHSFIDKWNAGMLICVNCKRQSLIFA
jgi:hypothetical protein